MADKAHGFQWKTYRCMHMKALAIIEGFGFYMAWSNKMGEGLYWEIMYHYYCSGHPQMQYNESLQQ